MTAPVIAVVTVAAGRSEHLRRQRRGLLLGPPALHVVVALGDTPPPVSHAELPTEVVHMATAGVGLPVAAARNLGAVTAIGAGADSLVFLDVDCIPAPSLVADYSAAVRRVPVGALVSGPVHYLPPPPGGGYPDTGLEALAGPHPGRPVPPDGALRPEPRVELFWSLSFATTTATWRRLGGFDEGYVGYGAEDTDFAVRAAGAGAGLWWLGGARAFHQHHPPARHDPRHVPAIVRNARRFHDRHGWWPMAGWLEELAAAGAVRFDPDGDLLALRAQG